MCEQGDAANAAQRYEGGGKIDWALPPKDELREWSCIRFPVLASGDKLSWYRNACKHDVDFAFSFTFLGSPQTFTHAHIIAQSILNLPFYPKLTDSELRRVTHVLREIDESFTS